MARIAGVDLPASKRLEVALTYIYGVGPCISKKLLAATGISPDKRARDLTDDDVSKIRDYLDTNNIVVEGDLRRDIALNIKRLKEIGCYRGTRHKRNLPVRGQRTKTNARTCKGPRKTIANKKK